MRRALARPSSGQAQAKIRSSVPPLVLLLSVASANGLMLSPMTNPHLGAHPTVVSKVWANGVWLTGVKGYFGSSDVSLLQRNDEDVSKFHEKERIRWREVYDEEYVEAPQEFYPGDRVKIVNDMQVTFKGETQIDNANGMEGLVIHYEFDDGYEACQCVATAFPLTVLLALDQT